MKYFLYYEVADINTPMPFCGSVVDQTTFHQTTGIAKFRHDLNWMGLEIWNFFFFFPFSFLSFFPNFVLPRRALSLPFSVDKFLLFIYGANKMRH